MTGAERKIRSLLAEAGITVNGSEPYDIQVHDQRAFSRVATYGRLGAGESYTVGWWDCSRLDEAVSRLACIRSPLASVGHRVLAIAALSGMLRNLQTRRASQRNASSIYDVSNDLYEAMLGRTMAYTCGYWSQARTLDEAQDAKHDLICRKLDFKPGMRLLDIGCGWGGLLAHAREHYGVIATGITLARAQAEYVASRWPDIEVMVCDYRDLAGRVFDRVTSVGVIEHVGYKNYRTFFRRVREVLAHDGMYLLQTIGANRRVHSVDPWMRRYIFPGGQLPSMTWLTQALESVFTLEDWHPFGADYDKTLLAWHQNFLEAWSRLQHRYDDRVRRMWEYYLLTCAGMFRARQLNLWQLVLAPKHGLGPSVDWRLIRTTRQLAAVGNGSR